MAATIPNSDQWRPLLRALQLPPGAVSKVVLIFAVDEPVRVLSDCFVDHDKLDAAINACIDIVGESGVEVVGK